MRRTLHPDNHTGREYGTHITKRGIVRSNDPEHSHPATGKFKRCYIAKAKHFCTITGATNKELAKLLGVGASTIDKWMGEDPETDILLNPASQYMQGRSSEEVARIVRYRELLARFRGAVKNARENYITNRVAHSLSRQATGYEYKSETVSTITVKAEDAKGNKIRIPAVKRTTKTHRIPPNIVATIFWLCNRDPVRWKNIHRQIVETSGQVDVHHRHELDLGKLGRTELVTLRDIIRKGLREAAIGQGAIDVTGELTSGGNNRPRALLPQHA
jgi:transposase